MPVIFLLAQKVLPPSSPGATCTPPRTPPRGPSRPRGSRESRPAAPNAAGAARKGRASSLCVSIAFLVIARDPGRADQCLRACSQGVVPSCPPTEAGATPRTPWGRRPRPPPVLHLTAAPRSPGRRPRRWPLCSRSKDDDYRFSKKLFQSERRFLCSFRKYFKGSCFNQ